MGVREGGGMGKGKGRGTVAAALFEVVVDGLGLVFGDVVENVEVLFLFFGQRRVELVGDHFVGAALVWQQFSLDLTILIRWLYLE